MFLGDGQVRIESTGDGWYLLENIMTQEKIKISYLDLDYISGVNSTSYCCKVIYYKDECEVINTQSQDSIYLSYGELERLKLYLR